MAHSQQRRGSAGEGKPRHFPGPIWFLALLICISAAALAFVYLDVPVARRVYGVLGSTESLGRGFASAVLLTGEAVVALTLIVIRITRGRLSPLGEATGLACLTSICAYAIDDNALKVFFGVPNPPAVLHGARHTFHLMTGSPGSSFPSGHMVLSGGFAGVFMRLYRRTTLPLAVLQLIGAVLLVVGDWHFVSDVIAGTFVGISAGVLAGEVWAAHSR
ncbi:MAG TPA: phosphatase PAP2 family protein [Acidobacteriaceae bacterium]|nr:phosphatase PAP2 family protein [Acidobacteriaceae bacterium]